MFFSSLLDLYILRKEQWLETEELKEIQRKKLIAIIKHAYQNVKYYRKLFDRAGIRPEDVKSTEDLRKIPITARSTLQSLPRAEITAKNVDLSKCITLRTSGTQGMPLTIYFRKEDKNFLDMVWARAKLEDGQRLKDKTVTIRYSSYFARPKSWFEYLGIWRKTNVSCLCDVKNQLEVLEKVNPKIITGYPSSLDFLARALQEQRSKKIRPRLIFTTAEPLDRDSRSLIASAFGAQLFDCYGAHELGLIAWECEKKAGYHINIDSVVVEFVWNGKMVSPGERGKLICTNLHSFAMPFIRYEIGDVGVRSDDRCPCGRGLPLVERIEGRTNDFFKLSNGRVVSPFAMTAILRFISGITQFRLVQEKQNECLVQLVKGKGWCEETIDKVREELNKVLGVSIHLKVQILDEIPRDPSGKLRSIISKVES